MILFRPKCRVAIHDRQNQRCRSTTKMLIPSRRTDKQVTSQKDSFRDLCLVERFHRAFSEPLISSPAHPTPTKVMFSFIQGGTREGGAYVSPNGANPIMRPRVMISHTITFLGLSKYIAPRRSSNSMAAFRELMTTIGWPAALR